MLFEEKADVSDGRWPDRDDDGGREQSRDRIPDAHGRDMRQRPQPGLDRLTDERENVRFRGRDYRLDQDDVRLLRTVGTFRAVYTEHLRHEFESLDHQVRGRAARKMIHSPLGK
jgi:hypothetical protein